MALGIQSSCNNHPAIEAVGRCKQCGKPFCGSCQVKGATGNFCSEECKQKHEVFTQRAQKLDEISKKRGFTRRLGSVIKASLIWGVIILVAAGVATYFGVNVPVLSDFIRNIIN